MSMISPMHPAEDAGTPHITEQFIYGGKHFVPEGRFDGTSISLNEVLSNLSVDKELGFCVPDYKYPSKFPYSQNGFYEAASDKKCDVFRCAENGKLYVPCQNDLQQYTGPYRKRRQRRKQK